MNWTGGRLQQCRRAKAGITAQQKAYFAKARARLVNENASRFPLDSSLSDPNAKTPCSRASPAQNLQGKDIESPSLQKPGELIVWRARTEEADLQKRWRIARPTRRKRRRDRHIHSVSSKIHETATQAERATIEEKRLELLNRADWLTPIRNTPLNIRFTSSKEREGVARRRKLNANDLERLGQQRRDRLKKILSGLDDHIDAPHDSISIRHGTQIHGTQRTQNLMTSVQSRSLQTFPPLPESPPLSSSPQEANTRTNRTSVTCGHNAFSTSSSLVLICRKGFEGPLQPTVSEESSWNPDFSSEYPQEHNEHPDKGVPTIEKASIESSDSERIPTKIQHFKSSEIGIHPFQTRPSLDDRLKSGGEFSDTLESPLEQYTKASKWCDAFTQTLGSVTDSHRVNFRNTASSEFNESHERTGDASVGLESHDGPIKIAHEGKDRDTMISCMQILSSDCEGHESLREERGKSSGICELNQSASSLARSEKSMEVQSARKTMSLKMETAVTNPSTTSQGRIDDQHRLWQNEMLEIGVMISEPSPLAAWFVETGKGQCNGTLAGSRLDEKARISWPSLLLPVKNSQLESTEAQASSALSRPSSQASKALDCLDSVSLEVMIPSESFAVGSSTKTSKQEPRDFITDNKGFQELSVVPTSHSEGGRCGATRLPQPMTSPTKTDVFEDDGARDANVRSIDSVFLRDESQQCQKHQAVIVSLEETKKQKKGESIKDLRNASPGTVRDAFRLRRKELQPDIREEIED